MSSCNCCDCENEPCECSCHHSLSMPRLNEPAPVFDAITTHGNLRLADFEGRWLILFSHPADFTPVCTTEFIGFAEIYPELQKRNVDLLGLSVDSVYSHIAWVRNIEEKTGVKIPFPVIADLNKEVAYSLWDDHAWRKLDGDGTLRIFHRPERHPAGDAVLSTHHRSKHAGNPAHDRCAADQR